MAKQYPHVYREKTRHGRLVWYFRLGQGPRIRLPEPYGGQEFMEAYTKALAGEAPAVRGGPGRGTIEWLISDYKQSAYWLSDIAESSRREYDKVLHALSEKSGKRRVRELKRADIVASMNERAATPSAANFWLGVMKRLFDYGVMQEAMTSNPCDGVKRLKVKAAASDDEETMESGHKAWSEDEQERFRKAYPLGTWQRLAFEIMRWTGLRVSDAARVGRPHVSGGVVGIRCQKNKVWVHMTIHPELQAALKAGPVGDVVWWVGRRGNPIKSASAAVDFAEAARAIGLVDCTCHGLRKAAAIHYAEAGKSEAELNAIFGWTDPEMAAYYVRQANRKRMGIRATATVDEIPNIFSRTQK